VFRIVIRVVTRNVVLDFFSVIFGRIYVVVSMVVVFIIYVIMRCVMCRCGILGC